MNNTQFSHDSSASILFIDSLIKGYKELLAGIHLGIHTHVINSNDNGIQQITQILCTEYSKKQIQEVHIVAHGSPGGLHLGNTLVTLETLQQHSTDLQTWFDQHLFSSFKWAQSSQSPHKRLMKQVQPFDSGPSRINLYACNLAAGRVGDIFINQLQSLTGATIYASTTPVGNAALGGTWNLDTIIPHSLNEKNTLTDSIVNNDRTISKAPFSQYTLDTFSEILSAPITLDDTLITDEDTITVIDVLANDKVQEGSLDRTSLIFANPPVGTTVSPDGRKLTVPDEGTYAILTQKDKNDTMFRFDGTDDGIFVGNGPTIEGTSHLTVSTRLRTTNNQPMTIVSQGNSSTGGYYHIEINPDGTITFALGNGTNQQFSISSTKAINDGEWHTVAVQREGRTGILWIDGEVQAVVNGTSIVDLGKGSSDSTTIGYRQSPQKQHFEGEIETLSIHSKSLSETDIFGYAAPDEAEVAVHRGALTKGAASILGMGVQGHRVSRISVTGHRAFGLYVHEYTNQDGNRVGDRGVGAAATEWGAGRLVLHTQAQSLQWHKRQGQNQTGQFYQNVVDWLSRTNSKGIKVVVSRQNTADWFTQHGYTNVVRTHQWWNELHDADLLIADVENAEHIQDVRAFIRGGGGVYIGRGAFDGHQYTKEILNGSGLQLTDDRDWIGSYNSIATENAHVINAINALEAGISEEDSTSQKEVGQTLREAVEVLDRSDPLHQRIIKAIMAKTKDILPSRSNPYRTSGLDRALLLLEKDLLHQTPPNMVTAHRTAESSYGVIPDGVPRVDKIVTLDLSDRLIEHKYHSTGIYVAPGEVVTVTVPKHLVNQGAFFRINNHKDNIFSYGQTTLNRFPAGISRTFGIHSTTVELANAFGGFIYLEIPKNKAFGNVDLKFENALEAPYFVLGKTTDDQWNTSIKNNPAPYAEIVTNNLVITLPSEHVREISNPTQIAMFWENVELAQDYLRGIENVAGAGEGMNIDTQISLGAAHSGYPTQAPQNSWASNITAYDQLTQGGSWGWFHELGHQHQRGPTWTEGDTEHTVNIFTMAAMDALDVVPKSGWKAMWDPIRRVERFKAKPGGFRTMKVGERLAMNAQLSRAFGWNIYRQVYQTYETNPKNNPRTEQDKRDQWVIRLSQATKRDLTPFFDAWQYGHSQAAKDAVAAMNFPKWSMIEIFEEEKIVVGAPGMAITFQLSDSAWGASANGKLTFTPLDTISNGTLTDVGDGQFTYTPTAGYTGQQTIDFQVTNEAGGQAILPVNLQTVTTTTHTTPVDTILVSNNGNSDHSNNSRLEIINDSRVIQGLLKFDNLVGDGDGQVPSGMEVVSAHLEYSLDDYGSVVNFHQMLQAWNDTDGWSDWNNGIQVDDVEASKIEDFSITHRDSNTHTVDVTETVQGWVVNPTSNHGWVIVPTGDDSMTITSAESTRPPRLILTYASTGSSNSPKNIVPIVEDITETIDEDTIAAIDILAHTTDPDAEDHNINTVDLMARVVDQPNHGRVHRMPDGKLAYIPKKDFNGSDSFTYQVNDGTDESNLATVNLIINDVNEAPIARQDVLTTDLNSSITFDPLRNDSDIDGEIDATSIVFVNPPWPFRVTDNGKKLTIAGQGTYSIDTTTDEITFTPVSGFTGKSTPVTYQISDDDNDIATGKISITVSDPSPPPPQDKAVDYTLSSQLSSLIEFTPSANFSGISTPVHYSVAESEGNRSIGMIHTIVNRVNDRPIPMDDDVSTPEDTAIIFDPQMNDQSPDGPLDPSSVIFVNPPENATQSSNGKTLTVPHEGIYTINPTTGKVTFTPSDNFNGTATPIQYQVSETETNRDRETATIQLTVKPVNDLPIARDDQSSEVLANTDIVIDLTRNDSDLDGIDDLTIERIDTTQTQGNVTINPDQDTVTYNSNGKFQHLQKGEVATDTFKYTVSDGNGGKDTATVTVTIQGRNSLPQSENSLPQSENSLPQSENSLPQSKNSLPQSENSLPQSENSLPQSEKTPVQFHASHCKNTAHKSDSTMQDSLPTFVGKQKSDRFIGSPNHDWIIGNQGNDRLHGRDGNDFLCGGRGRDFLKGGRGRDEFYGGSSADQLYGNQGKDFIKGGGGRDRLFGQQHKDVLEGDKGNDLIVGGFDKDQLTGGKGKDTFLYQSMKDFGDVISDFESHRDRIDLTSIRGIRSINDLSIIQRGQNTLIQASINDFSKTIVKLDQVILDDLDSIQFKF